MAKYRNKCIVPFCRNEHAPGRRVCYKHKQRKYREENPIMAQYHILKWNAGLRNITFDLTYKEFKQFIEGTDYLDNKGRTAGKLQIDRIDNNRGYVKGNLQIITMEENLQKEHEEDLPF